MGLIKQWSKRRHAGVGRVWSLQEEDLTMVGAYKIDYTRIFRVSRNCDLALFGTTFIVRRSRFRRHRWKTTYSLEIIFS
jgi:hypothetical protein